MKLYEINEEILECIDEDTGEIIDEAKLEELELKKNEKIEGVCLWIKNLQAEAEALKKEKDAFAKREQSAKNKIESLKKYINFALNGEKFISTRANVSYRASESVEVVDLAKLPQEFLKFKEPEADKVAIKKAIKDGAEIDGVEIVKKQSVVIK